MNKKEFDKNIETSIMTKKNEINMVIMDEMTDLVRIGKILEKKPGEEPSVKTEDVIKMHRKLWE